VGCQRSKYGSNYQFSKDSSGSLSSPAPRTESVAQFLDFSVVFDVCPSKTGLNFRKN
jgi:hypothetical protein